MIAHISSDLLPAWLGTGPGDKMREKVDTQIVPYCGGLLTKSEGCHGGFSSK
jgi:hypothetical protein